MVPPSPLPVPTSAGGGLVGGGGSVPSAAAVVSVAVGRLRSAASVPAGASVASLRHRRRRHAACGDEQAGGGQHRQRPHGSCSCSRLFSCVGGGWLVCGHREAHRMPSSWSRIRAAAPTRTSSKPNVLARTTRRSARTGIVRALIARDGGEPERLGGDRAGARQHDVGDVEGAEHGGQRGAEVLAGAVEDGRAVAAARPRGGGRAAARRPRSPGSRACRTRSARRRGRRRRGRSRRRRTTSRRRGGRRARGRRRRPRRRGRRSGWWPVRSPNVSSARAAALASLTTATGRSNSRGEVGGERQVRPAEVGGRDDDAVGVDDAGAGDADAEQRSLGVGDQLAADPPDEGDGRPAGLALAVVGAADDDLAGEVDDGADEVGRLGQVEAQRRGGRRRRCRRASPACRPRRPCSARAPRRHRRRSGRGRRPTPSPG